MRYGEELVRTGIPYYEIKYGEELVRTGIPYYEIKRSEDNAGW